MQIRSPRTLGLVIRNRRRELKLSQAELARKVGVGRHWVVATERGKHRAEIGLVLRTLNALDIPLTTGPAERPLRPGEDDLTPVDLNAVVNASRGRRS